MPALAVTNPDTSSSTWPMGSVAGHEVREFASIAALLDAQPSLTASSTEEDLFHTAAWFDNLLRCGLPPDTQALLCWVSSGEGAPGFCLPLTRNARAQVALGGPALQALTNYYSCLYGPIGAPQALTLNACRALVRHLRRAHRMRVLDLQPLAAESALHDLLLRALRAEGYAADSYFCFGNWHAPMAGRDFDSYYAGLPSKLRNTIKRGGKKLDTEGAQSWTLAIHHQPGPDMDAAVADFVTVYGKSWKSAEPYPGFIPGLCHNAAAQGWLRLGVVRLRGQPIAAQLWLVRQGKALIYKLAYDEDFKRFSAGSVLTAALMRHAIDIDKADDIDYLTGDDAYKQDWMSHRRLRHGVVAFRITSWRGLLAAARHFGGRWARQWRGRRTPPGLSPSSLAQDDAA